MLKKFKLGENNQVSLRTQEGIDILSPSPCTTKWKSTDCVLQNQSLASVSHKIGLMRI